MAIRSRVAAVTGANKGIGLAIGTYLPFSLPIPPSAHSINLTSTVRNLALSYPSSPLYSGPFLVYLTARSPSRGAEAVRTLNADPKLRAAKVLAQDGGDTTIKFQSLDISDAESICAFRDFLKKEHPEGIDVVVNNAGIAMNGFGMSADPPLTISTILPPI